MTDRYHVVVTGDNLWNIACRYYHNPLRWYDIYIANQEVIWQAQQTSLRRRLNMRGANWIFPGTVLKLPGLEQINL
jgi:nucleoid-associated protein YgaU